MIGDIKEVKTGKTHSLHTLQKRNQLRGDKQIIKQLTGRLALDFGFDQ